MPNDTICRAIVQTSIYVAEWIDRQPAVKEESITDWSLDRLADRTNYRLAYRLFTPHEEGRITGADFEWWILGNERAFRARVQAKRLRPNADNYPSLAYANEYGLQIVRLVENANAVQAAAFYFLYGRYPVHLVLPQFTVDGMFIAEADDIDAQFVSIARQYVRDIDVLYRSIPLSIIFCRAGILNPLSRGLSTLVTFIKSERGPQKARIQIGDLDQRVGIYKTREIPPAVASFVQAARQQREIPDAVLRDSLRGVAALFTVDLR